MWTEQALRKLSKDNTYHRDDLFQIFRAEKPDLSDSTFRWILYNLQKEEGLFRTDYDSYSISKPRYLPEYHPVYSEKATEITAYLVDKYPGISFVVCESVLLNEFLNHQIAQNTIYVQIEKDISSFIFDIIKEEYTSNILYKPNKKEFDRYWTRGCIVVLDLISQAPMCQESPHDITAEKLLVDIIAEKSIAATYSPAELPCIFENVMNSYRIDKRRLNRYAGRRGKAADIKKYIKGGD